MGASGVLGGAGLAMNFIGGIGKGRAEASAMRREEQNAKRKAEVARIEADQTQTVLLGELTTTLQNIQSIRAATGANPDSPTTIAIMDNERKTSEREQRIRRSNSTLQALQSEDDAKFYRRAQKNVLRGAAIGAAGDLVSGLGSMAAKGGF